MTWLWSKSPSPTDLDLAPRRRRHSAPALLSTRAPHASRGFPPSPFSTSAKLTFPAPKSPVSPGWRSRTKPPDLALTAAALRGSHGPELGEAEVPPAGRRAPWQRAPAICVAPVTLDPVFFVVWFGLVSNHVFWRARSADEARCQPARGAVTAAHMVWREGETRTICH